MFGGPSYKSTARRFCSYPTIEADVRTLHGPQTGTKQLTEHPKGYIGSCAQFHDLPTMSLTTVIIQLRSCKLCGILYPWRCRYTNYFYGTNISSDPISSCPTCCARTAAPSSDQDLSPLGVMISPGLYVP